ncbi:dynein light chain Tctex-type 5-like [Lineus longissimus]|uniref:dynein light chain Tctex-type 5-like n=1 Tax=Lineus longissimus TaxID=88925 RepID=UPI002B4D8C29
MSTGKTLHRRISGMSSSSKSSDEASLVDRTRETSAGRRLPVLLAPGQQNINGHGRKSVTSKDDKNYLNPRVKKHSFTSSHGDHTDYHRTRNISLSSFGSGPRSRAGTMHTFKDIGTALMNGHRSNNCKHVQFRYENSYHMPEQIELTNKFLQNKVERIIGDVLEKNLKDCAYDSLIMKTESQKVSKMILERVKSLGWDRYRYVCTVSIGQQGKQAVKVTSRCVWDTSVDNSASGVFENSSIYAVATVFAVYFE